jgi:hypothetical protein
MFSIIVTDNLRSDYNIGDESIQFDYLFPQEKSRDENIFLKYVYKVHNQHI